MKWLLVLCAICAVTVIVNTEGECPKCQCTNGTIKIGSTMWQQCVDKNTPDGPVLLYEERGCLLYDGMGAPVLMKPGVFLDLMHTPPRMRFRYKCYQVNSTTRYLYKLQLTGCVVGATSMYMPVGSPMQNETVGRTTRAYTCTKDGGAIKIQEYSN